MLVAAAPVSSGNVKSDHQEINVKPDKVIKSVGEDTVYNGRVSLFDLFCFLTDLCIFLAQVRCCFQSLGMVWLVLD